MLTKRAKRKSREMSKQLQYLTQNLFILINQRKSFLCLKTKGKEKVDPFDYLNKYCRVKMALIIEGIFISKTVTSLHMKVHEVYIKPLKPREALLTIKESDDEGERSEGDESDDDKDETETLNISDIEVDE